MTGCAHPGCPSAGNYAWKGKYYCQHHYRLLPGVRFLLAWRLPIMDTVSVEGKEN